MSTEDKCPGCGYEYDHEATARAIRALEREPEKDAFWESTRQATIAVSRWPSWKAKHCTCETRRLAVLERVAADVEAIARWVAGDGLDAQRAALADGIREGRWIGPDPGVEG